MIRSSRCDFQPEENQCVLANVSGHLLLRDGEYSGQSVDDLALYLDYRTTQSQYRISNLSADQTHCLESAITRDQIESFHYELPIIKKPKQHPLNVLPKAKTDRGISGYWKACAAVLVAALITQFSYDAVRWYQYKKVANITAGQAIDQFKYWFGQNYPVAEQTLKSQFEAQLRQSQTGNAQALALLSRVGPVLMQNQIVANRVNYDASMLNMELKANSAEVLQNLTHQLKQQGFKVELGNIQPGANGAIGLVRVQ